nr:MAG TPA: hypothetical protein [Caudoviricetes sp.]
MWFFIASLRFSKSSSLYICEDSTARAKCQVSFTFFCIAFVPALCYNKE